MENLLGDNIKHLRRLLGLSQSEFGAQIKLTRGMIDSYESGRSTIGLPALSRISEHYHVPFELLKSRELQTFTQESLSVINKWQPKKVEEQQRSEEKLKDEIIAIQKKEIEHMRQYVDALQKTIENQQAIIGRLLENRPV